MTQQDRIQQDRIQQDRIQVSQDHSKFTVGINTNDHDHGMKNWLLDMSFSSLPTPQHRND